MTTPAAPRPPTDNGAWILRSRALLDASARDLDGATRSRLAQARNAAIDGGVPGRATSPATTHRRAPIAPRAPAPWPRRVWLGAGAAAAVVALAVLLVRLLPLQGAEVTAPVATRPAPPPAPRLAPSEDTPLAAPDFDLLVDAEDDALLDDLEFYAWLDAGGAQDG